MDSGGRPHAFYSWPNHVNSKHNMIIKSIKWMYTPVSFSVVHSVSCLLIKTTSKTQHRHNYFHSHLATAGANAIFFNFICYSGFLPYSLTNTLPVPYRLHSHTRNVKSISVLINWNCHKINAGKSIFICKKKLKRYRFRNACDRN